MLVLGRSPVLLRLGAIVAFLGYLFAGASLALPAESRCARCAHISTGNTLKPGASCPLSRHGHHCHNGPKKTSGHITLCPDGCLRHDGQGGEIPSLIKFLSAPSFQAPIWGFAGFAVEERPLFLIPPFLAPPDHPPSARS